MLAGPWPDLRFVLDDFLFWLPGQVRGVFGAPHAVTFDLDPVRVVDNAVKDCVCDCWLSDHLMPA